MDQKKPKALLRCLKGSEGVLGRVVGAPGGSSKGLEGPESRIAFTIKRFGGSRGYMYEKRLFFNVFEGPQRGPQEAPGGAWGDKEKLHKKF